MGISTNNNLDLYTLIFSPWFSFVCLFHTMDQFSRSTSTHGFQGKAVQVVMSVCSLSGNWPVITPLLRELCVVLVLLSHLPFHSHPTATSQKEEVLSTHLQSSILLLQHVIASGSPNKGTSDLEIRSVTMSMRNIWALRKWTLTSEFTFHPTGPGSLIHQDTRYIKIQGTSSDQGVSLPGRHHLRGRHCLGTKISNPKLRTVQEETQDTSQSLTRSQYQKKMIKDQVTFWLVLFLPSFCNWVFGGL